MTLWQFALAFASDTVPMDLTDSEELIRALEDGPAASGYMAVRASGAVFGNEVKFDTSGSDEELVEDFTKAEFQVPRPSLSPNYNVGVSSLLDSRNLRKLSNSQRKRVLQGLHELVASDNVLRSLFYNATMSGVHKVLVSHFGSHAPESCGLVRKLWVEP